MNSFSSYGAVILTTLLVASGLAQGTAGTHGVARLDTPNPPAWSGALDVTSSDTAMLLAGPTDPPYALQADLLHVELVRVSYQIIGTPVGDISYQPTYDNQTFDFDAAHVVFTPSVGASAYARISGSSAITLSSDTPTTPPIEASPRAFYYQANDSSPSFFRDSPPTDAWAVNGSTQNVKHFSAQGAGKLFFADGKLDIVSSSGELHEAMALQQSRVGPTIRGHGAAGQDSYSFARIEGQGIRITNVPREIWTHPDRIAFDGSLTFASANGVVEAGMRAYPLVDNDVTLSGTGSYEYPTLPAGGIGARHYEVAGTFTAVHFFDGRIFIDSTTESATALTLIALVLLALTRIGRGAAGSFFGALYTRIKPARVLQNEERAQLWDLIQERPGSHLRDLQRAMGWGWGTLHYHLGVLRRGGLVAVEMRGKHALVYASTDRRRDTQSELGRRGAAAPVHQALYAGAKTQRELQDELRLSRQLVAHHLTRLHSEGLIKIIEGRPKRYVLAYSNDGFDEPAVAPSASS